MVRRTSCLEKFPESGDSQCFEYKTQDENQYNRGLEPVHTFQSTEQPRIIGKICGGGEEDVAGKGNKTNGAWVLDHCHEEDKFRGWLCHKCNRGLGCFHDDIQQLKNAIKYLNES